MHQNALRGEARSIQFSQHGHPRLGHAVFAAVQRHHICRAGRNVDDGAALDPAFHRKPDHVFCNELGKEHAALCVDAQHAVVAFLGHLQQVGAGLGCHACVVDQNADLAQRLDRFPGNACTVCAAAQISAEPVELCAVRFQRGHRIGVAFLRACADDPHPVSVFCQLPCCRKTDAAACSGD